MSSPLLSPVCISTVLIQTYFSVQSDDGAATPPTDIHAESWRDALHVAKGTSKHANGLLLSLSTPHRALMRGLTADERSSDGGAQGAALAAGVACERMCRTLVRTLGAIGSSALLSRALLHAQAEHAALHDVSISAHADAALDGIALAAAAHGETAVVAGLEAVQSALLALLGRLIGKDMVARLVAQSDPMGMAEEEDK